MTTTCYGQTGGNAQAIQYGSGTWFTTIGQQLNSGNALIGTSISGCYFKCSNNGSSPSNSTVSCKLLDSTGSEKLVANETFQANTLTSSLVQYDFTFPSGTTIAIDDMIVLTCPTLTTGEIFIETNSTDSDPNTEIVRINNSGSIDNVSRDCTMCIDTDVVGTGTRLPPPPIVVRF